MCQPNRTPNNTFKKNNHSNDEKYHVAYLFFINCFAFRSANFFAMNEEDSIFIVLDFYVILTAFTLAHF